MFSVPSTATVMPAPGTAERLNYLAARPVLSLAEAGELTGLSRSTLTRCIASGDLPASKVGRKVMIPTRPLRVFSGAEVTS